MNRPTYFAIITVSKLTSRSSLPCRFAFIAILISCLATLPMARAVSPPPDGGYPNGNTAEGDSALFSLTSGVDNTAVGAGALFSDTSGSNNTGNGFQTLNSNSTGSGNTAAGDQALHRNSTGNANTATGSSAHYFNTYHRRTRTIRRPALTRYSPTQPA